MFDMDGVIVDSMPYHFLSWYETLKPLGIRVTWLDIYLKEGEHWEKTLKHLLRGVNIKPTREILDKLFAKRTRVFKNVFKRFIFPGAPLILTRLKRKGYSLGLVTGTPAGEIKKILPLKLKNLFSCIVAGDQVKRGKPHPESYLRAAAVLNVRANKCLVVENAPYGIASAKAAGMFCVGVTTSLPKEYLKAADVVIEELEEIFKVLGVN